MNSRANNSLENATGLSRIVPSTAEGIALCTAFILSCLFIVVGNVLTIVLFAKNRRLRSKKSLFLIINMAFADLMLGTVTLPIYIFSLGASFQFWKGGWSTSLYTSYTIVGIVFSQASLISAAFISGERFYAIYWPFKHRTLSLRAYRIIILTVWALTLFIAAFWGTSGLLISIQLAMYVWTPYVLILTFIICGCNISIWRNFRQGNIASQQQNRESLNKRLTKTLMLVSILTFLSCIPLVMFNCLIYVYDVEIPLKFYHLVDVINYSISYANIVVYALKIPEFRKALRLCCLRRPVERNMVNIKISKKTVALAPATELKTSGTDTSALQLAFEEEVLDTKL